MSFRSFRTIKVKPSILYFLVIGANKKGRNKFRVEEKKRKHIRDQQGGEIKALKLEVQRDCSSAKNYNGSWKTSRKIEIKTSVDRNEQERERRVKIRFQIPLPLRTPLPTSSQWRAEISRKQKCKLDVGALKHKQLSEELCSAVRLGTKERLKENWFGRKMKGSREKDHFTVITLKNPKVFSFNFFPRCKSYIQFIYNRQNTDMFHFFIQKNL